MEIIVKMMICWFTLRPYMLGTGRKMKTKTKLKVARLFYPFFTFCLI